MISYGVQWFPLVSNGFHWVWLMFQWFSMVFNGFHWCPMIVNWFPLVVNDLYWKFNCFPLIVIEIVEHQWKSMNILTSCGASSTQMALLRPKRMAHLRTNCLGTSVSKVLEVAQLCFHFGYPFLKLSQHRSKLSQNLPKSFGIVWVLQKSLNTMTVRNIHITHN